MGACPVGVEAISVSPLPQIRRSYIHMIDRNARAASTLAAAQIYHIILC